MFKLYPCIVALLLLCSRSFAQNNSITIDHNYLSSSVCVNSTYKLPVISAGTFNADNKYAVQIRKTYANNISTEISATLVGGFLEFVIPDNLTFSNSYIQMRATASSPRVQSEWSSSISVHTKGNVVLNSSSKTDTLNAFDRVEVILSGSSFLDTQVTLSDSSKINFYASEGSRFSQPYSLTVASSGTYTIAHAENFCGAMTVSGKYTAVVNKTAVRTMLVTPTAICENTELSLRISTSGEAFTNATKYKVRFNRIANSGETPLVVEAPATAEGNMLKTRFPANANINGLAQYYVQVVTENPATVSAQYQSPIQVWSAPNATFNTQSQTINFGGYLPLTINMTGVPPYSVELTNGTIINSYGSPAYVTLYPTRDENFSIKSVTTGCGKTEIRDPQVVEIKVRPGIKIEEQRQLICVGAQARIKVNTNANFTGASQFFVKLHNPYTGETSTISASKNGDYIEFALPARENGYTGFGYQITTLNPTLQTDFSYNVVIQSTPNVQYAGYNETYVYERPQTVSVRFNPTGGSPYKIEYMDGTVAEYEYEGNIASREFFLKSDTEFKIKSISNSCFSNNNPRSVALTVKSGSAPGIYLEPVVQEVCETDSIEVVFGTVGSFNAGNKFYIQGYANCCEFQNLQTVEGGGKYRIKIKSDYWYANSASVRIVSTNPVLFSEVRNTTVHHPLANITIYPETTPETPSVFLASEGRSISVRAQSVGISNVTYSIDEGADQVYTATYPGNSSIDIPIKASVGRMSVYKIKSISNTCGSAPVNLSAHVIPTAYRIQLASYNGNSNFCPGDPISVSFGIGDGKASASATFDLEFIKQNSTEKTVIVKGATGTTINGTIPANMPAGYYYARVVSSEGPVTYDYSIQVSLPATATLLSDNMSDNVAVEAGQGLNLKIILTGTGPWSAIWQDNSLTTHYSGTSENYYIYPQRSQEYAIKQISNACGYGTVSGSVKVSVKPRLDISANTSSVCPGNDIRISYNLAGEADLSNAYIRFVLVDLDKNIEVPLDSTKIIAGQITLKIPATLTGSRYRLRGSVTKYDLATWLDLYVTTKAELTISGNTTINSGTSTQLALKSTKSSGYFEYTLSDGTRGTIYASPGQINYVRVQPRQTTTYTIASVRNECGAGEGSGSATVEVNPPSARSVNVTSWSSVSGGFCTSDTISVSYATQGTFTSGNVMTVQISDTTGKNFRSITTIGNTNPLKAILPTDLTPNGQYRMRIAASEAGTSSGAYEYAMVAGQKAKARFASESVIFDGKTNPKITVLLEGGAPWTYQWGTDLLINTRQTFNPKDEIELFQASPNQYYRLFRVYNNCGSGTIDSPATVRVEMVTASEPALTLKVTVAPNPVQEILNVTFENAAALKKISLYDMNGRVLRQVDSRKTSEEINIAALQRGLYLLVVESKGRKSTFKVVKQ